MFDTYSTAWGVRPLLSGGRMQCAFGNCGLITGIDAAMKS